MRALGATNPQQASIGSPAQVGPISSSPIKSLDLAQDAEERPVHLRKIVAISVLALALAPSVASAQRNNGGNQGASGAGAGGGRGNRGNFQQMQMGRLKTSLDATDDEWKVLEPKILKVQELQRSSGRGGFGGVFGGGGRGGRRGGGGNAGAAAAPDP